MDWNSKHTKVTAFAAVMFFVGWVGYAVWFHLSKTPEQIARETVVDILCNTDVLQTMAESDAILEYARTHHQTLTMNDYAEQAKRLQAKLVAITKTVRAKGSASPKGGNAVRAIASVDNKGQSTFATFVESTSVATMKACPDKAANKAKVDQGVKAVIIILKHS